MKLLFLIVLFMSSVVTPAFSQVAADDSFVFDALVAARNRNQIVQLFLGDSLVSGRVQHVDRNSILVQRWSVAWEQIDSARIRFVEEDPVWNGAFIGAGITGVLLAVVVGAFARGVGDRALSEGETLGVFMGGAVIGAAVGVGMDGALVGPASWQTIRRR